MTPLDFDNFREEDPILWATLVLGPCTPSRIAKILVIHPETILDKLRELKRDGLVTDSENPREGAPMVWEVTSQLQEVYDWRLDRLKDWNVR